MKKKNLIYFLVPLVGLVVFGLFYWNFSSKFEAREAAQKAKIKQEKEAKLEKEAKDREKAIKDALAAQERRKAEKAAKEAKEKADQEARQLAIDARDKANRDQIKLAQQKERLQKDIKDEQAAIAKLQAEKKDALDEQTFLKNYVKQAQANAKSLHEVLDKIAAADAARAAAEAAAAKAKNNS
jgi:colicin import membrane protein